MQEYLDAIIENEHLDSSLSHATSIDRLGSRASDGGWALLQTFDILAHASLNVFNGVGSTPGTAMADAEDYVRDIVQGDTAFADLDAATLALQVGGTADAALVAWGA